MNQPLTCVELNPAEQAVATVIWLHGLGADGNDFVPIVPELKLPDTLPVRFVFPHAPIRPVTINAGMSMRAWYDILSMGASREVDEQQLDEVCEQIAQLIRQENERGIPCEKILLVGFSQGGAVAYQTALKHPQPLAGLACMSTYRIKPELPKNRCHDANIKLPVWVAHGEFDPVVPIGLGREGYESLAPEGLQASWQSYPMDHEVCLEEVLELGRWMMAQLSAPSAVAS
ncbi:MAG: alpha/beta fold hydrolase [Motiliproteus sp.]